MPLQSFETRELREGSAWVVDGRDGTERRVIPNGFDVRNLLLLNHCIDRGSIGCAALAYCLGPANQLWMVHWGTFHDGWNVVKSACKATQSGHVWKAIVRFSSVANLGFGPFRSGSWRVLMRETLCRLAEQLGPDDRAFQEAASLQAALEPQRFQHGSDSFEDWWHAFTTLPSCCHGAAPILKFARWFSVSDAWSYYRREFFLLGLVLREMAGGTEDPDVTAASTSLWDSEAKEKTKGGLIAKAPTYITWEIASAMDVYELATRAIRTADSHRAAKILSTADHLKDLVHKLTGGGWQLVYSETVRIALGTPSELSTIAPELGESPACALLFELVMNLLGEHILRELPHLWSYPGHMALLLAHPPGSSELLVTRDHVVFHWSLVLRAEEQACRDVRMSVLLSDIIFLKWAIVRLIFGVVEQEAADGQIAQTRYLAECLVTRLGDEKVPEDFHSHVRDAQRDRRHKGVSTARIYSACQISGVLERRCEETVQVSLEEIAAQTWRRGHEATSKADGRTPEGWPKDMDSILEPHKSWDSLTTLGSFNSTMSWMWLLEYDKSGEWEMGSDPACAWWSRLLIKHSLVWCSNDDSYHIVLRSANFGAISMHMEISDDKLLYPCHTGTPTMATIFVTNPSAYLVVPYKVVRGVNGMAVKHTDGCSPRTCHNILQHSLLVVRQWTAWEMRSVLEMTRPGEDKTSNKELFTRVVKEAFPGDDGLIELVLKLYKDNPVPPSDEADLLQDTELQGLLEELAHQDIVNAVDLRAYQDDLTKVAVKNLAKRRLADRERRNAETRTRRARAATRKVATNRLSPKALLRMKRLKRKRTPIAVFADGAQPVTPPISGAAAPVPAAAPPAPPPAPGSPPLQPDRAGDDAPPAEGGAGEWRVIARGDAGWIKYSARMGQADAHCKGHGDGVHCKMDRKYRFGSVALSCLWLSRGRRCTSAGEHALLKETLSLSDALPCREAMRRELQADAQVDSALAELLALELAARNGKSTEPARLPCKPIAQRVLAVLAEP